METIDTKIKTVDTFQKGHGRPWVSLYSLLSVSLPGLQSSQLTEAVFKCLPTLKF